MTFFGHFLLNALGLIRMPKVHKNAIGYVIKPDKDILLFFYSYEKKKKKNIGPREVSQPKPLGPVARLVLALGLL